MNKKVITPIKFFKLSLRYTCAIFFFAIMLWIAYDANLTQITSPYSWDENLYQNISNNFTINHLNYLYSNAIEPKPVSFLALEKVMNNADPTFTRSLAYILISLTTLLIYNITKNKLSFAFILIPITLDSMWLTAEIIEVTMVLLAIVYASRSGIFIGISTILRPTSLLYSILLSKKQIINVLMIGTMFAMILVVIGLFFPYYHAVTTYVKLEYVGLELIVVLLTIMLLIMGGTNRFMLPYVIIAAIPLYSKMYDHYFLPVMTFLYIGFLLEMNKDIKDLGLDKNEKNKQEIV